MSASAEQAETGFYERYIACLNARAWDRLGEFVTADAVHNGRRLGVEGYRALLEDNCRDIPDLYFHVEFVVAERDRLASRLRFDCRPANDFLGVRVDGKRVVFHEHAFYTLRCGKIAEVHSVIDKAALEAQASLSDARPADD